VIRFVLFDLIPTDYGIGPVLSRFEFLLGDRAILRDKGSERSLQYNDLCCKAISLS